MTPIRPKKFIDPLKLAGVTFIDYKDSKLLAQLLSGDEKAVFGDSAYSKQEDKREARKNGVHYGMLDKATRRGKLSNTQKKNNRKKSTIRAKVEHPFAFIKSKLNYSPCFLIY